MFDEFFHTEVEHIDPAAGASEALSSLKPHAEIVILTNAPDHGRGARGRWLAKHGFHYPMVVNSGLKGPAARALADKTTGQAVFIDDLLPNLDSVAQDVPGVRTFQMVADPRLRPLAPSAPERHPRHDDWIDLRAAIEEIIRA